MSLYLSMSCLVSFISLGKFIPKYFIVFYAIKNGIVFLTSFIDCSLLAYRNATDCCILILHPLTLLNLFISSNGFLVVRLFKFSTYKLMSSVNGNNFTSFQFGGLLFLFLSPCWTVVARAGILVPDSRGKAFRLSPPGMMLTTGFSCTAFITLK